MSVDGAVAAVPETPPRADTILAAAAAAFSERGFAATTMREIAASSGASLGSIYYHFASKEEILRELMCGNFRRVLESLEARMEGVRDPREQIGAFIDNHVRFFARHLAEMRVMSHELDTLDGDSGAEVARLRREYARRALRILARLRPELDGEELRVHALCLFGMLNWTYRWFDSVSPEMGASGVAGRMTELFLDGFGRP